MRRVEMSRDKSFLVVEGRDLDAPFYSRICESSPAVKGSGYQVWLIEQIRDDGTGKAAGGKPSVLSFFDFCKKANKLRVSSPLGDRVLTFCLDLDNEQITGGRRRSPHIMYTRLSDVEAELFAHGITADVLMSALSLDRATAQSVIDNLGNWRLELASSWRGWIELCCLAKSLGARCDIGFGHESSINQEKYGPVDATLEAAARSRVIAKSRLTIDQTRAAEKRIAVKVASVYSSGSPQDLLKGKWLPSFLEYRLRMHFATAPIAWQGFTSTIKALTIHTINYSEGWASPYRLRLEANI